MEILFEKESWNCLFVIVAVAVKCIQFGVRHNTKSGSEVTEYWIQSLCIWLCRCLNTFTRCFSLPIIYLCIQFILCSLHIWWFGFLYTNRNWKTECVAEVSCSIHSRSTQTDKYTFSVKKVFQLMHTLGCLKNKQNVERFALKKIFFFFQFLRVIE